MKFAPLLLVASVALCALPPKPKVSKTEPPAEAAETLSNGRLAFRGNCAFCHGLDGHGGRGASLVSVHVAQGLSDAAVRKIIKEGISGTGMPGFGDFTDSDLDGLVMFVRSLSAGAALAQPVPGDPIQGEKVYAKSGCAGCHRIGERGSDFGPELTRIGGARAADYLRESIINPSADIPEWFEAVTVITKDGHQVSGLRANEDTFTVQLRLSDMQFATFRKDEVRSVAYPNISLMPPYKNLSAADLQNLLAFLDQQRGPQTESKDALKAKGIH